MNISFLFREFYFTSPENPMKARDNNPAVTRVIGNPFISLGTPVMAYCSLIPASKTRAKVNPTAVDDEYMRALMIL